MFAARFSVAVLVLACSACAMGTGGGKGWDQGGGGSSSGGFGGSSSGGSGGDDAGLLGGDDGGTTNTTGCTDGAKLVYVLSVDGNLHSFDPSTLTFKLIGHLNCASSGQPNSMAVDRSARAYVNYFDGVGGQIFSVSTSDASCQPTSYGGSIAQMGMGFSTNGSGSSTDTLYVAELTGGGFGGGAFDTLDVSSFALKQLGSMSAPAELTGTGDGRLYAFFAEGTSSLAQVNKSNGSLMAKTPLSLPGNTVAFAFSFWGGSFWFYTSPCDGMICTQGSTVHKYDPSTGQLTVAIQDVGFIIDGAGESTCAPVEPPK